MTSPAAITPGELHDGRRTALRLVRLYAAGDAWRSWRARAVDDGERDFAAARQVTCRRCLRTVEAFYARELAAYLAGRSHKLPEIAHAERVRILDRVRAVAERRMPMTIEAWRRAMAEPVPAPTPSPKKRTKRQRVESEDTVLAIKERAQAAGDRATVRDCNVILRGQTTASAVRAFLEKHDPT